MDVVMAEIAAAAIVIGLLLDLLLPKIINLFVRK
jgi:hypothetical protein